jgi:signal transduction histidine kinase
MLGSALLPGPIITTPDQLDGTLPGVDNPVGIDAFEPVADGLFQILTGLGFMAALAPLVWTATRWRRSTGVRRRQFRWVTLLQIGVLLLPGLVLAVPGPLGGVLAITQTLVAQVILVVAISQWQAFDADVVIRRAVLAGVTLASGLAVYAVVVAAVSVMVADDAGSWPSTMGAAVAILTFGPLSVLIRRGVNRAFYGRRDDPYVVVTETARRLTGAADPGDGITATLTSLTEQLRLPYAAVVDDAENTLSASGIALHDDEPIRIPITHHGRQRGTLVVGHRRGTIAMTAREVTLLGDVATQLGPALAALEQLEGLRTAQTALVATRDDERLRIQRDLHDGLGSAMTAITLKLAAATNHLDRDETAAARPLVRGARDDLERAVGDVRRLVYSLGDPTAPTRRLADVIAEDIAHIAATTDLDVTLDLAGLPDLPADAAEQVRRIIGEAVTNVVRHAEASTCTVRARCSGDRIEVVVEDDGLGLRDRPAGVGRWTMAKRAEQVGATLQVLDRSGAGTTVSLALLNGAAR